MGLVAQSQPSSPLEMDDDLYGENWPEGNFQTDSSSFLMSRRTMSNWLSALSLLLGSNSGWVTPEVMMYTSKRYWHHWDGH